MEENIVDVLLRSSVSFAPFEEHEPSLSAFTISPDDYQSFVSFLLSVFLLGGFSLENGNRARSTSLFAPARTLHPSSDAQI
tara:strand:- start:195 stop:437 length:243 start_codon:yes stop_codon:yes gene_type:complete